MIGAMARHQVQVLRAAGMTLKQVVAEAGVSQSSVHAIQNGYEALFTSAAEMIEALAVATRRGELAHTLVHYTHPPVLVIDEVGYLAVDGDAANLMFQVVNERYLHRRPMLFTNSPPTSRSPPGGWCCTIPIWPRPSSIGCSSGAAWWSYAARRIVPGTSKLSTGARRPTWSEYPEMSGQTSRNPHASSCRTCYCALVAP